MNEDFEKLIGRIMEDQNKHGLPDFEGFSPVEMSDILYNTLGESSPIRLIELTDDEYRQVPLLNQLRYLAGLIRDSKGIKLTQKGFLPVKVVAAVYGQEFLKNEYRLNGSYKVYRETDSLSIHLTRILLELTGIVKKRNNIISLTKKAEKLLNNPHELLREVLLKFGTRFNWAYFDGYGQNNIGQMGWGFSLILLSKFGMEKRPTTFYANKYFTAFPMLHDDRFREGLRDDEVSSDQRCYALRTFVRFMDLFGFVEIEETKEYFAPDKVTKTPLFDKLFQIPHRDAVSMN